MRLYSGVVVRVELRRLRGFVIVWSARCSVRLFEFRFDGFDRFIRMGGFFWRSV